MLCAGMTDWVLDPQITSHPLATLALGPMSVTVINDFHLAKQLFDKEEFSGKGVAASQLKNRYFNNTRQVGHFTSLSCLHADDKSS